MNMYKLLADIETISWENKKEHAVFKNKQMGVSAEATESGMQHGRTT